MNTDLSPVSVTRPGLRFLLEFARDIGAHPFAAVGGVDDVGPRSVKAQELAVDHVVESLPWKQVGTTVTPRRTTTFGRKGGGGEKPISTAPSTTPTFTISLAHRDESGLLLCVSGIGPEDAINEIRSRLAAREMVAQVDLDATAGRVWLRHVRFASPKAQPLSALRDGQTGRAFLSGNVVQTSRGQQWTWLPALLSALPEEVRELLSRHAGSTVSAELSAATKLEDIATLVGDKVDQDALARLHWPDPTAMTFEHCIPFGLAILESWFRQRVAWATNTVEVEPGVLTSTGGEKWLTLDADDLWLRVRGTTRKTKNWRSWLWNNLTSLAGIERCELRPNGTMVRKGRLLNGVFDGRRIRGAESAASADLQQHLRDAGYATARQFFVRVSEDWAKTFIPYVVDLRKQVRWGHDSVVALKERDQQERGRWSRDDVNDHKNAIRTNNYFRVDPAWLVLGRAMGMSTDQQILLLSIWSEAAPRAKRRKGATAKADGPETRVFGGSTGAGYRLDTWLWKAGYADRNHPSAADLRRFLKDLRWLAELFGFELADRRGETLSVENYLKVASQPRHWRSHVVHLRLPATHADPARIGLAAEGIVASPAPPAGSPATPSPGAALTIARKSAGMTQRDLAAILGVSHVMVSHWERGEKQIAVVHQRTLSEVLPEAKLFGDEVNSAPELLSDIAA